VRELIARCWRPDPEGRPSFASLVSELENILSKLPRTTLVRADGGGGCCTVS
jgi:hypothetical protein